MQRLIGQLRPVNFFPWFHLEADSIFGLAFADKMTKNVIATKTQQEHKPQNSLPAAAVPEHPLSVTNQSCSNANSSKKVPHQLPLINKLQSRH